MNADLASKWGFESILTILHCAYQNKKAWSIPYYSMTLLQDNSHGTSQAKSKI